MSKLPPIVYLPKNDLAIKGRIVYSYFEKCYCNESTKNYKPKKNCKRCKGKGGTTLIWLDPINLSDEDIKRLKV